MFSGQSLASAKTNVVGIALKFKTGNGHKIEILVTNTGFFKWSKLFSVPEVESFPKKCK